MYLTTYVNIETTGNSCKGTNSSLISQQVNRSYAVVKCHADQKPREDVIFLKLELGSLVAQANVQVLLFKIMLAL